VVAIAIIIVAWILVTIHGIQPFTRLAHSKPLDAKTKIETLKEDLKHKANADNSTEILDAKIEQAKFNAKHNVQNAKPTTNDAKKEHKDHVTTLRGESYWDLLTPKEDTMREYGVTQQEFDALVAQYRKEHTYEVESAPTTLTFSVDKWEEANNLMRDSMRNIVVEKRPYEDGLIDQLYKEGDGISQY
jgi:hypothetical protein